jgi:hypothetical protein
MGAKVVAPDEADPDTLLEFDLIGFGSGIHSAMHHPKLLRRADGLPAAEGGKAFLFSTDGVPRFAAKNKEWLRRKMLGDHAALQKRLKAGGYQIAGNFSCAGFDTNSFLKLFGGFNKGRPDAGDLAQAKAFAAGLSAGEKR